MGEDGSGQSEMISSQRWEACFIRSSAMRIMHPTDSPPACTASHEILDSITTFLPHFQLSSTTSEALQFEYLAA